MFSKTKLHMEFNYYDFVTDSDLVTSVFRKGLEKTVHVDKVYMTRLYYRNKALVLQYHVYFDDSKNYTIYYGKLFHVKDDFEKYKSKLDTDYYFSIDEYNLVVLSFPYDPKLKILTEICSEQNEPFNIRHLLQNDVQGNNFDIIKFNVLGYRLERRAVLELFTKDKISVCGQKKNSFIIKLVKKNKSKDLFDKSRLLEKYGLGSSVNESFSIPKIYGYDEKQGSLLMEKVQGTTLHELISQSSFGIGCQQAANIIKKVHTVPTDGLSEFSVLHELRNLSKQIAIVQSVYPNETKLFTEALEILETASTKLNQVTNLKCIHRDFYDKQVLYSKNRTTIVDFDNLSAGDPALDFGNFIAHLYLRLYQTPENTKEILEGVKLFQDTYDGNDQFLERAIWWESASLLRIATIYLFRPRWKKLTVHLLRKSISCLS